ncbi:hypothetical protein C2G38_2045622 [Gigaspora rosea]|uniref:Uncharacterized protein n=1 Tax=Gigaspora rosea TaxID=44941 RepID=A0A397UGI8_9GLOM|nr:hypothetical protein C2G38_2045622 [Gigaspora rosea]
MTIIGLLLVMSLGTFTNYDEDDESDESDVECELRLNVDEFGFDEYINQGNKSIALDGGLYKLREAIVSNFSKTFDLVYISTFVRKFAYESLFGEVTGGDKLL